MRARAARTGGDSRRAKGACAACEARRAARGGGPSLTSQGSRFRESANFFACARAGAGGEQQRAGIVMRVARCTRRALAPHEPTQRERGAQRTCVRLPENGGDVYTDSSSRVRESDERAAETARSRGSGELGKTAAWMALQQAAAGRHCGVVVCARCACVRCWDLTACMRTLTLQLSAVTRPSVASDPENPEKPC